MTDIQPEFDEAMEAMAGAQPEAIITPDPTPSEDVDITSEPLGPDELPCAIHPDDIDVDAELSPEELAELKAIADASVKVEAWEAPAGLPPWYECAYKHRQVGPGNWVLTNAHDGTTIKIERTCMECVAKFFRKTCSTKVMKKQPKAKT